MKMSWRMVILRWGTLKGEPLKATLKFFLDSIFLSDLLVRLIRRNGLQMYLHEPAGCLSLCCHINMINMQTLKVAINSRRIDNNCKATRFMERGPTSCRYSLRPFGKRARCFPALFITAAKIFCSWTLASPHDPRPRVPQAGFFSIWKQPIFMPCWLTACTVLFACKNV